MDIVYLGACLDASGYAEASRNYIAALDKVGVNVRVAPVSFEQFKSELGTLGKIVTPLINKVVNNKIQILHMTPENYPRIINKSKYNIGYATWETSKLPAEWVPMLNLCDEIWVPCDHNVKVFKSSGVTKPVLCIPHTFDRDYVFDEDFTSIVNIPEGHYTFYSIFQWTERKNPSDILKAYLTEFTKDDKTVLVIKTYLLDPRDAQQAQKIKEMILTIKGRLHLKNLPKILLITSLLGRAQIQSLHRQGDCYISPHRCEGFGIPIVEAMLAGNPVIVTPYGGPADFVKHEETGYYIDYRETPVYGMPFPTYRGDSLWADPDTMSLRKHMRYVFENQDKAAVVGETGKQWILDNLSWETIGKKMKDRLEVIEKGLS